MMDAQAAERRPIDPQMITHASTDHPMISMPFMVEIDGRQYRGEGLSLVRAQITGLMDPAMNGAARLARLLFSFHGFTIAISATCKISDIDGASGQAVLTFDDPTGAHLPQLRHLINSYIAGDLVTMGQVLGVAGSEAGRRPKDSGPKLDDRKWTTGRALGTTLMVGLSAALVIAVTNMAYVRFYTAPMDRPALVMPEGQMLTALASGQIDYLNPDALMGEVAYSIRSSAGPILSVAMPCDCVASLAGAGAGATVMAGEPVLLAHPKGAPLVFQTTVPADALFDLVSADRVELTFPDGLTVDAKMKSDEVVPVNGSAVLEVSVILIPATPLSPERQGQMARLVIVKPLPAMLSPLAAVHAVLGSQS
jgi:mannuronan synthase